MLAVGWLVELVGGTAALMVADFAMNKFGKKMFRVSISRGFKDLWGSNDTQMIVLDTSHYFDWLWNRFKVILMF